MSVSRVRVHLKNETLTEFAAKHNNYTERNVVLMKSGGGQGGGQGGEVLSRS